MDLKETAYRRRLECTEIALRTLPLHRLDRDCDQLARAFSIAYDEGIFALHDYDASIQETLKFVLFSRLPALSGSLAFLAVQILAANRIMQENAFHPAPEFLKKRSGIAVNHLRAPVTVVDSVRDNSGYRLNGRLTWASGYRIFDTLVAGFHHGDAELQAVVPFRPQSGFKIGEPVEAFVGQSLNTVDIELDDYEVPFDDIVSVRPMGSYTRAKSVSKTVHFALYGIGLGAVGALEDDEIKREARMRLERQKEAFMQTKDGEKMDRLRLELFTLVQQIVTTGMVLKGGSAIQAGEPLQRYYRELILFNSNGLNPTIKGLFKSAFLQGRQ